MVVKTCTAATKICAMFVKWNGNQGGRNVAPKVNARNFWEYNPEEGQICFEKHLKTKAWNSCSNWQRKYS